MEMQPAACAFIPLWSTSWIVESSHLPEDLEEPEAPEGRGREHLVVGAGEDDGGGAYCYYIWKNVIILLLHLVNGDGVK